MFDNFNLPAGCSTDDFDFEEDPDEPYFEYELIGPIMSSESE